MPLVFMGVGWWAAGFLAAHLLAGIARVDGPRPICPKCWGGSLAALGYGIWTSLVVPPLRSGYSGPEYLYSVILAAVAGGAVYLAISPIGTKKINR